MNGWVVGGVAAIVIFNLIAWELFLPVIGLLWLLGCLK